MTLFQAKDASISAKRAEAGRRGYDNSAFVQRLIEQNKALRAALYRISALQKRMDELENSTDERFEQQEIWNAECETNVKQRTVPSFTGFSDECPCGTDSAAKTIERWGSARCFHCPEAFDSPDAMARHTASVHHPEYGEIVE
jgi:hypothetical protein